MVTDACFHHEQLAQRNPSTSKQATAPGSSVDVPPISMRCEQKRPLVGPLLANACLKGIHRVWQKAIFHPRYNPMS